MYGIISGALMMVSFVIGIIFMKFWKKSHDRLFLMFGIAFWMMAFERFVLGYLNTTDESHLHIYFIRMIAFAIILIAIVLKNKEGRIKTS